jgi:hypothetical protein
MREQPFIGELELRAFSFALRVLFPDAHRTTCFEWSQVINDRSKELIQTRQQYAPPKMKSGVPSGM